MHRNTPVAIVLLFITFIFLSIAVAGAVVRYDFLNPDGIMYLRLAERVLEGESESLANAYWNPLLPLLLTGFQKIGLPHLSSFRFVLVLSGLFFVGGFYLLSTLLIKKILLRLIVALTAGIFAGLWSSSTLSPDLLLAAAFTWYLFCILKFTDNQSSSWLYAAGVCAVVCYAAKSVALPFILLHLPFSVWYFRSKEEGMGVALRRGFAATLPLIVIAGAWILLLSLAYNRFETGASARINFSLLNPQYPDHPFLQGLNEPSHGLLSVWEDPAQIAYPEYQPWQSLEDTGAYLLKVVRNFYSALALAGVDRYGYSMIVFLLSTVLFYRKKNETSPFEMNKVIWVAITVLLYAGLYAPVLSTLDQRYFWGIALLAILGLAAVFEIKPKKLATGFLLSVVLFAVLYQAALDVRYLFFFTKPQSQWRHVAAILPAGGRIAATNWKNGLYIAWQSRADTYLGSPLATDPAGLIRELDEAGADVFVSDTHLLLPRDVGWMRVETEFKKPAESDFPAVYIKL